MFDILTDRNEKPIIAANFAELDNATNQIEAILENRGIKYSARYIGEKTRDKWQCDAWKVSFIRGNAAMETDYYTGLGYRKSKAKTPQQKDKHSWQYMPPKPVTPDAAGVLYSLCMDAQASDMSFQNWCDDYGYDSDSITAFNTYQACERIAKDLYRVFDRATIEQFREVLQDY